MQNLFFTFLVIFAFSCNDSANGGEVLLAAREKDSPADHPVKDTLPETGVQKKKASTFPFQLVAAEAGYYISADLGSEDLYPKYHQLFKKYGYEGNGYAWEGLIQQILEKLDPSLLSHVDFDSEGGSFFAIADSRDNAQKFAKVLSPIFSDMKRLEDWIKKADRSRIDD